MIIIDEVMNSTNFIEKTLDVFRKLSIEADGYTFHDWQSFEIVERKKDIDYPKNPGIYFLRQAPGEEHPYDKSDIVKIGRTKNEKGGLKDRLWQYQRKDRTAYPYGKKISGYNRQTAWKVRHFMTEFCRLEIAFFSLNHEYKDKTGDIEIKLISRFDPDSDETPRLEGEVKDYQNWCRSKGHKDDLCEPI